MPHPFAQTVVIDCSNLRVADIAATRERLRKHGIEFITDPWDREAEIRAYVRDPDGHLIEIGEATGILESIRAR